MMTAGPRRILVVEDEYLLANDLKEMLDQEGAIVIGPVATEADAFILLEEGRIDCAILDINLRGRMVYSLARALREHRVPFLFVSGYDALAPDAYFEDVELIQKPFTAEAVMRGLARLLRPGRAA